MVMTRPIPWYWFNRALGRSGTGYDHEFGPMRWPVGSSPHVEDMRHPSEPRCGLFERLINIEVAASALMNKQVANELSMHRASVVPMAMLVHMAEALDSAVT